MYISIQFRKKIILQFRQVRKVNSKITASYNENLTGVRVVKALVREDENLQEFSGLTNQMYSAGFRAAWLSALFLPIVQIISSIALSAVLWYGGYQNSLGLLTIGGIQAFVSYITAMMWPVQDLARIFAEMQHAIASAERIFSLVDSKPEIVDHPESTDPGTILSEIEFDHVDFHYEKEKAILTDFSLKVQPGEMIALVGPTGGGKTTIVNLLCRFLRTYCRHDQNRWTRLYPHPYALPSTPGSEWFCKHRTSSQDQSAKISVMEIWEQVMRM